MRINLTLIPKEKRCYIPINYQYPLSAAIYKILSAASPEFANFLHAKGYLSADGKPMKLFTFSYLDIPDYRLQENLLILNNYPTCQLKISSPMIEDFIQHLVIGLFTHQELAIGNQYTVGRFHIQQVESLPTPEFKSTTRFKSLSPFVVSTMKEYNGKLTPHYFRPADPGLNEAIRLNLIKKYETIYHQPPENQELNFILDQDYVRRKGGPDKITKLITLKEHSEKEATRVRAINAPFTLSGSTELMQVAWEAGLGTHCSQGFGCVEVLGE
jgi:CRISPR-associated endoribonuclease Cas6